jgi:hypothetical protein
MPKSYFDKTEQPDPVRSKESRKSMVSILVFLGSVLVALLIGFIASQPRTKITPQGSGVHSEGTWSLSSDIQQLVNEHAFKAMPLVKGATTGLNSRPASPTSSNPYYDVFVGPANLEGMRFLPGQMVTFQFKMEYDYPSVWRKLRAMDSVTAPSGPPISRALLFVVDSAGRAWLLKSADYSYLDGSFNYVIPKDGPTGQYKVYALLIADDNEQYAVYRTFNVGPGS